MVTLDWFVMPSGPMLRDEHTMTPSDRTLSMGHRVAVSQSDDATDRRLFENGRIEVSVIAPRSKIDGLWKALDGPSSLAWGRHSAWYRVGA